MQSPEIIIREIELGDAASKIALDRSLAADGRGMVLGLDQVSSIEREEARIKSLMSEPSSSVELVAVSRDGCVVGNAQLRQLGPRLCRHVGLVALGVHPEFQGRGLGRKLMQSLLERTNPDIFHRIELYVRADNSRAINLYESFGFRHEAVRKSFIWLEDGSYVDDLIMVRFLNPACDGYTEDSE